jgi:ADP-ribosylglycohydrolase
MNNRYIASIVLHALGDTIGFKNGEWEFNYFIKLIDSSFSNDLLFDFISLGGINDINLKGWKVSDDTLFHMNTCQALLDSINDIDYFCLRSIELYINNYKNNTLKGRYPGNTMTKNLQKYTKGLELYKLPYNRMYGGSGASMRTSCIGLLFNGEKNRKKLIEYSIENSRLTHNSIIGYMGGFVSALFTAYAIEEKEIEKWPFLLLELLESNVINNYMKKTRGYNDYMKNINTFIDYWKTYIELRFTNGKINKNKSFRIPSIRTDFYIENFSIDKELPPGSLGHDSVIIAYDALVDAKDSWEKLVVYSMLHVGDSDTVGCIAGSWYGALYGFKGVPENNLQHLEFKKELYEFGNKLYNQRKN